MQSKMCVFEFSFLSILILTTVIEKKYFIRPKKYGKNPEHHMNNDNLFDCHIRHTKVMICVKVCIRMHNLITIDIFIGIPILLCQSTYNVVNCKNKC